MGLEKKSYTGRLTLKAAGDGEADPGTFEAVFATMNVEDLDHDVTVPGAFGKQMVMVEPWNHNYQDPPVGVGSIAESENDAIISGKFFLDTASGKEHYQVVKAMGDLQEWSYTFYILEAEYGTFNGKDVRFLKKMDVVGVSPVSRGAGIDTRTTTIKGIKPSSADGEAGNGKPSGAGVAYVRAMANLLELED